METVKKDNKDVSEMALSLARMIDRLPPGVHMVQVIKRDHKQVDVEVKFFEQHQTRHVVFRADGPEDVTDE